MSAVVLGACVEPKLGITVHHAGGGNALPEGGEAIPIEPLKRDDLAHHKPGYAVLRSTDDWDLFFADPSLRPVGIDFSRSMVIAAYAGDSTLSAIEIRKVVDSGDAVNVFVTEVNPGDGCASRRDEAAFSLVTVEKRLEPVAVYVDSERGARCEANPPMIAVTCRVPPAKEWRKDLVAPIGQVVECAAAIDQKEDRRTIVDRDWSIRDLPRGSDARISLIDEARKASIAIDALGTYRLRVAATDEAARVGEAIAKIEVPPPSDDLYVELVWSNFGSGDDPDAFPRVELHAGEGRSIEPKGAPPKRAPAPKTAPPICALDISEHPSWCDVSKYGKNTLMRLKGDADGRYTVALHYVDDRFTGAPVACMRTFTKGKLVLEICDNQVRKAGAIWFPGTIGETTGLFEEMKHAPAPDGGVAMSTDDIGARDAGK